MVYSCCDCKKHLHVFLQLKKDSKCFGHNPIFDDPKIMAGTKYQNGVVSHEIAHITQLWAS